MFKMKQSAPVLGELLILIEGVLQTFGVGQSLGGGVVCLLYPFKRGRGISQ
jgi:hypothetical protein